MKYIAEYLGNEVEIRTNFRNLHTIVHKLNDLGFNLGSGHDGLELKEQGKEKVLICTPYVGKMTQHIHFRQFEEN